MYQHTPYQTSAFKIFKKHFMSLEGKVFHGKMMLPIRQDTGTSEYSQRKEGKINEPH